MTITDKIKSLGDQVGVSYRKPDVRKLEKFQMLLLGNQTAMDYLRVTRNLTEDTIKHFGLGYDSEKNAIAIPVYKRGELVNIKYRFLDPEPGKPKYINDGGTETWLFNDEGIDEGVKKGGILIVEGEFDCMSTWQAGLKNVVSPASGKDSYGVWIELIDNIPKVYICYDNDKPGREAAMKFADRLGFEKCFEVGYPSDVKDANEYFKKFNSADYRELLKAARPFYKHQFKGLADIIAEMRSDTSDKLTLKYLPDVKLGQDWIVMVSGKTNVGKTSYVMNLAQEIVDKGSPVLVLPFERGPQVVGQRYLQVKYSLGESDVTLLNDEDWDRMQDECATTPLYFAMPSKEETLDVIKQSKRIFNTRVVIVDHLDYMIRNSQHKEQEISATLQNMKRVAEDQKILFIVVTHVRKTDTPGAKKSKAPGMDDLKGSSALSQDPECVVMLSIPDAGSMAVDVVKNKGKMSRQVYGFNVETGRLKDLEGGSNYSSADDDLWDSVPTTPRS